MPEIKIAFVYSPTERLKQHLQESLGDLKQLKFLYPPDENEETLVELCRDADIIIGWRTIEKVVEEAKRLSLYIFPGAGVHSLVEIFRNLDRKPKPLLLNSHSNSYFVAQHMVAMLLALTNKIVTHHRWMREGKWLFADDRLPSIPLRNRHIGFLGYGAINRMVHKFLAGFDLKFSALRRNWSEYNDAHPTELNQFVDYELGDFLQAIDILLIAVPVTSETEGMIGETELQLLGKNGLLINVARGKIVDEKSLYEALEGGIISGAALDVWYDYDPEPDDKGRKFPSSYPFYKLDNVVLSPHRAASPFDDPRQWDDVIENIRRFAVGRDDFINIVELDKGY